MALILVDTPMAAGDQGHHVFESPAWYQLLAVPGGRGSGALVAVDKANDAVVMWNAGAGEADSRHAGLLRPVAKTMLVSHTPSAKNDEGDGVAAESIAFVRTGVIAVGETEEFDYDHGGQDQDGWLSERTGGSPFGKPQAESDYAQISGVGLISNGTGASAFLIAGTGGASALDYTGATTGSVSLTGGDGTFQAGKDPIGSTYSGLLTAAISASGQTVIAWQQHDDSDIGPSSPATHVMLATSRPDGTLEAQAVANTTSTGLPEDTAVAPLNSTTAVIAWRYQDPHGRETLRATTVALNSPSARQSRLLANDASMGALAARTDGRGGAILSWISNGRVMALLDPGNRPGAPTRGKVIALSSAGENFSGPFISSDGTGHVVVSWIRDGHVEVAAGTLADGLQDRRTLGSGAKGLSVSSNPAPTVMLAWASAGQIKAARVSFP